MTVPALQIQNRLVHPRLDGRRDAALPRGDARGEVGVAPRLRDGPAGPVACLLTGALPIRDQRDAALRAPRERQQRGAYWAARRRPRPLGEGPMPGRPARRPAATSEAAPQSRAMGPSSGRERGSAISAPYRSSDCQCAPSTSPQIGIPFPNRRQVVKQPHLQSSDFVHPHACQSCHASQRRARCATSAVGRHVSSQRTVAFGIGSFKASGRPRIEPSVLTRNECQLASQSCWQGWNCRCRAWPRLPHQLDLRARDCEANHVPRQRLDGSGGMCRMPCTAWRATAHVTTSRRARQ